jgi:hypothetical protein
MLRQSSRHAAQLSRHKGKAFIPRLRNPACHDVCPTGKRKSLTRRTSPFMRARTQDGRDNPKSRQEKETNKRAESRPDGFKITNGGFMKIALEQVRTEIKRCAKIIKMDARPSRFATWAWSEYFRF